MADDEMAANDEDDEADDEEDNVQAQNEDQPFNVSLDFLLRDKVESKSWLSLNSSRCIALIEVFLARGGEEGGAQGLKKILTKWTSQEEES